MRERARDLSKLLAVPKAPEHSYLARRRHRYYELRAAARRARAATEPAVSVIIAATASPKFKPPKRINRRRLYADIKSAALSARLHGAGEAKHWKPRQERMRRIKEAADNLARLLGDDDAGDWCRRELEDAMPAVEGASRERRDRSGELLRPTREAAASMRVLQASLVRLGRAANRQLTKREALKLQTDERSGRDLWPSEFNFALALLNIYLLSVFKKWFISEPTFGRPHNAYTEETGKGSSPYVRFVKAVLDHLGERSPQGPYTTDYLTREMARARQGKSRRKGRA